MRMMIFSKSLEWQYPREINIWNCDALSSVIPCYAAGQMQKLQVLKVEHCSGMKEVFETQGMNNNNKSGCDEGNGGIPRPNNVFMLLNLKILKIDNCPLLEHLFTFSVLESLRQLQELTIERCWSMKVIVKEEEYDDKQTTTKESSKEVVVFPNLKSITLFDLPELMGFFLGMNEFRWPSLDYVMIQECPQMRVFAPGGSTTPKLKYIHTILGKHSLEECDLDFHVTTGEHYQTPFPGSLPATSEEMPWSFHNLIELHVEYNDNIEKIIPFNELPQLQKLEKICVSGCSLVEEVFEALEAGTNSSSGFDESQTTIFKLPNLTQMKLQFLWHLRYIWKSNQWRTVFEFPNLTKVDIDRCDMLEHVFTSSMVGSLLQLQELSIINCSQMAEVISNETNLNVEEEEGEEESDGKTNEITLPRLKSLTLLGLPCLKGFCLGKRNRWTRFEFPNLTTVKITSCNSLEHVFTSSMVGSLLQLQELSISSCSQMVEVISSKDRNLNVEEEEGEESDGKTNVITLPRLKSLRLINLQCLEGFCLGKQDFSFPLLDTLRIEYCPAITTFTTGNSATPQLIEIESRYNSFYVPGEGINSTIKIKQKEFKKTRPRM